MGAAAETALAAAEISCPGGERDALGHSAGSYAKSQHEEDDTFEVDDEAVFYEQGNVAVVVSPDGSIS